MAAANSKRRTAVVLVRDDQIASLNPALEQAQKDQASGDIDTVCPIYVLDDETIAETRPSLTRLHFIFFRLWRLGDRVRQQGGRLEFRQGELGYQAAQYAEELCAERVYITTDDSDLGKRQTARIRKNLGSRFELIELPPLEDAMNKEYEEFVPYWELFNEEEMEAMGL